MVARAKILSRFLECDAIDAPLSFTLVTLADGRGAALATTEEYFFVEISRIFGRTSKSVSLNIRGILHVPP